MVEEKVERVVFTAHFQAHLPPHKGKARAQFEQEFLDVGHQRLFYLGLAARVSGAEKVEQVGVFEQLCSHVGLDRRHGECKVVLGLASAQVQLVLDVHFQDGAAPALGDALVDVEVAGGRVFGALHDLEHMAPGQLRNSLLRNWARRELAGEDLHRQEVARRQTTHVGEGRLKIGRQAINDLGAPGGLLLAGQDDVSRAPVGLDDDGIGRQHRPHAGTAQVGLDVLQRGGVAVWQ